MLKGTFILVILNSILFISPLYISAMDTSTEMIEIIKGGEKILVPLTEIAKKITPVISSQKTLQTTTGLLGSTYQCLSTYPKETLQIIGYASLFCSIIWFANSKKCFITPGAYQKLREEKKIVLASIAQEEAEVISDVTSATKEFILAEQKKRFQEAQKTKKKAQRLNTFIAQEFNTTTEEEDANHKMLFEEQKKHLEAIVQNYKESQEEQSKYFQQEKGETHRSINGAFTGFNNVCNDTREKTIQEFDTLCTTLKEYKTTNAELHRTKKSHLANLSVSMQDVRQSSQYLEDVVSQLNDTENLTQTDLESMSANLDEHIEELLALEENLQKHNNNSPIQFLISTRYEEKN
jgi:hypothetical protein